jgi:hypothetical protein
MNTILRTLIGLPLIVVFCCISYIERTPLTYYLGVVLFVAYSSATYAWGLTDGGRIVKEVRGLSD